MSGYLATDKAAALLPCPFCGGDAYVLISQRNFTDASVMCRECSAEGPMFDCQDETSEYIPDAEERNRAAAIAAWNHRTPLNGEGERG